MKMGFVNGPPRIKQTTIRRFGGGGKVAMSYNDVRGPRVVGLTVASSLSEYLMRIQELGAVEGADGALEISPEVRPVLEAIHQVLAGGTVEVKIVHRGNPDIVNELNRRVEQVGREANTINKAAGFYLTATL